MNKRFIAAMSCFVEDLGNHKTLCWNKVTASVSQYSLHGTLFFDIFEQKISDLISCTKTQNGDVAAALRRQHHRSGFQFCKVQDKNDSVFHAGGVCKCFSARLEEAVVLTLNNLLSNARFSNDQMDTDSNGSVDYSNWAALATR